MTQRETKLTDTLMSRPVAVAFSLLGIALILCEYLTIPLPADTIGVGRGTALPAPAQWFNPGSPAAFPANIAVLAATAVLMGWLNSTFNILRSYSLTFTGLFILMCSATPVAACRFEGSSVVALTVLLSMSLMLTVYGSSSMTRRVFLAFLLVATGTLTQYALVPYLAVLIAALAQMRVMSARTLTAALLGIATPVILLWAFCDATFPEFHMPRFDNIYATWPRQRILLLWSTAGLTLLTGTVLGVLTLVRIFGYNAKARAINGLLTLVAVTTAVMSVADYTNMPAYIVLLNACTAFQAGHFAAIYARRRGYLVMIVLPVLYTALAVVSIMMP